MSDSKLDKIMRVVAPLILFLAGMLVVVSIVNSTHDTSKDNNVYVRYIACVLSVPPADRSDEVIEQCWDHVIEESNREVHRYDSIGNDNHYWLK